ncbi:MAG: hypothetical protein KF745_11105 [Phycisphaeraceae bacterium]|nr:hypothetical protein [Phycisphaeraceae bacterium]
MLVTSFLVTAMSGCDSRASQIRESLKQLVEAVEGQDGRTVASLYSKSTVDHYGELVKLAREGKREQIAKRSVNDRGIILMLRHRLTGAQLRQLDGAGTIALMADRGWWGIDNGVEEYGKIRVSGNTGWMEVREPDRRVTRSGRRWLEDTRRTYNVRFYLEDDVWKMDETSLFQLWEELLEREVKAAGMSADAFLIEVEEMQSDTPVPRNIWDTPPKK